MLFLPTPARNSQNPSYVFFNPTIQNPNNNLKPPLTTMFLTSQTLFTNPNSKLPYCSNTTHITPPKNPNLSFKVSPHFQILSYTSPNPYNFISIRTPRSPLRAFGSEGSTIHRDSNGLYNLNFDTFLSIAEFLCLASSAVLSIVLAVNCVVTGSQKAIAVWLGNRVLVWQVVVLVGGIVIGAWIRRRQWRRVWREEVNPGGEYFNLVRRIEKLEEDLQSSATIIRVLSRQLEKLGIRFRVTRKALKEPIAETAALAQKNSEATRALAAQEDTLEKELGEIQKVLLLMQEQQQKQLELILAIGKSGKLWESKRVLNQEQDVIETSNSVEEGVKQIETHQI